MKKMQTCHSNDCTRSTGQQANHEKNPNLTLGGLQLGQLESKKNEKNSNLTLRGLY
jgi:hypothetical protein